MLWYDEAANDGNVLAMYNLGLILDDGKTDQRTAQAAERFRQAAERGYGFAMYRLALLYREGRGVDTDLVEAAGWFRKAVAADDIDKDTRTKAKEALKEVEAELTGSD